MGAFAYAATKQTDKAGGGFGKLTVFPVLALDGMDNVQVSGGMDLGDRHFGPDAKVSDVLAYVQAERANWSASRGTPKATKAAPAR